MSKKFKVPQAISRERRSDEGYVECLETSLDHRKQLRKAESDISNAIDFCETLRGHLIEEEAYTEVTVVKHIEKLIRKARNRMDLHGREYSNLFVAYFDLKGGAS